MITRRRSGKQDGAVGYGDGFVVDAAAAAAITMEDAVAAHHPSSLHPQRETTHHTSS